MTMFDSFPLLSGRLKPQTRRRYVIAESKFLEFIHKLPPSVLDLHRTLLNYIEDSYSKKSSPGKRKEMMNLLSHIYFFVTDLRSRLNLARRSVGARKRSVPNKPSLSLNRHFLLSLVARMKEQGHQDAAVALAVAWRAYLRASETLKINYDDVALPSDIRCSSIGSSTSAGIGIFQGKTGKNPFTLIHDYAVVSFLSSHILSQRQGKIFNVSYNAYLQSIKEAAQYLDYLGHSHPTLPVLGERYNRFATVAGPKPLPCTDYGHPSVHSDTISRMEDRSCTKSNSAPPKTRMCLSMLRKGSTL
eukprot:gb/GEZJ01006749.1/.p1 GENE.gb/GEZJ01006749.1/~~gb/GEZJ01006749.1/.p1  ORF type:complete len:302 (+),score=24.85 gb/GEZJ01006749.1/:112-1017(+)